LAQTGSFWTSRHFRINSCPILDLITCKCSRSTPASIDTFIYLKYNGCITHLCHVLLGTRCCELREVLRETRRSASLEEILQSWYWKHWNKLRVCNLG
jgi:hypothetical protein